MTRKDVRINACMGILLRVGLCRLAACSPPALLVWWSDQSNRLRRSVSTEAVAPSKPGRGPFASERRIARMQKHCIHASVLAVAFAMCAGIASAQSYTFENLRIDHPYARPTPPGARSGGAYFTIENRGAQSDRLLRVTTTAAGSAEIH